MAEPACLQDHELLPLLSKEPVPGGLQTHLESCPVCRQRLARLRSEVRVLRDMIHGCALQPVESGPGSAGPQGEGKPQAADAERSLASWRRLAFLGAGAILLTLLVLVVWRFLAGVAFPQQH